MLGILAKPPRTIWKFLEHDQTRPQRARMPLPLASQRLDRSGACRIVSVVQVCFARDASNHHVLHEHESRPPTPDRIDQTPEIRMNSSEDIFIEDEEWLYRLNLALTVPDGLLSLSLARARLGRAACLRPAAAGEVVKMVEAARKAMPKFRDHIGFNNGTTPVQSST
jgi:hypothetical protein